jgi:hypothetical protein
MMSKILFLVTLLFSLAAGSNNCTKCHGGIEHIRDELSDMSKAIAKKADEAGYGNNSCIVCHGGNPNTKHKNKAHKGTIKYFLRHSGPKDFYANPAATTVNQNSCGICHTQQVSSQYNSLMKTHQSELASLLIAFGRDERNVARFAAQNPTDNSNRSGSEAYKKYMQKLAIMEPKAFFSSLTQAAKAPTLKELEADPSLAAYLYFEKKVLNKNKMDDKGCASCHIPYSKDGKMAAHSIQSSRDTKIKIHEIEYSGVPLDSCVACHSKSESIGLSYQGLISQNDGKKFMHLEGDIHFKKGMLCQDCHTSNDLHGDGFLSGAQSAAVEIECQDCHGTTLSYPWELPLGYSDEHNLSRVQGEPRATTQTVAEYLRQGSVAMPKDGYLLSARGNPLVHAVRDGDEVLFELANGKELRLQPLKKLKEQKKLSKNALFAMEGVQAHLNKMECYSCHTLWAPQKYAQHLTFDYSSKRPTVAQTESFIRWEEPMLSLNGEGRIAPTIPEYQIDMTLLAKGSKELLKDYKPGKSIMTPLQPHTVTKGSRSCESCHTSSKSLGLGSRVLKGKKDYMQLINKQGVQLQSLGESFTLQSALSKEQRDKIDRRGSCLACHQDMPDGNLAVSAMQHMAMMADVNIDNKEHKNILHKILNIGAWTQVLVILAIVLLFMYIIYTVFIKKESINPKNRGWK